MSHSALRQFRWQTKKRGSLGTERSLHPLVVCTWWRRCGLRTIVLAGKDHIDDLARRGEAVDPYALHRLLTSLVGKGACSKGSRPQAGSGC